MFNHIIIYSKNKVVVCTSAGVRTTSRRNLFN